jgi:membrane protease YdiL (CAAX protease family)
MSDVALAGFLASATAVTFVWARALWYFGEHSFVLRRVIFFVLGRTHRTMEEIRALLLTAIYYVLGLLAGLLFVTAFRFPISSILAFGAGDVPWVILGIIGEISATSLLVELGCRITAGGPVRFAELREIPWMRGLRQLPPGIVPFAAALAGAVEEAFFRGVVLGISTTILSVSPIIAMAIAGGLFCLGQLLQVQTLFQAMVIASSSVAISVIGGLLVLARGSVVPAMLCHASFVIFFMTQGIQRGK